MASEVRLREVRYRLSGPAGGWFPGAHRSRRGDTGFEFRGHAPLADAPDARRLDLHASLRDPFGQWQVRLASERKSIAVVVLADRSASMAFEGTVRKTDVLADLVQSLAWSAWRSGDAFGYVGAADAVEAVLPLTRHRGAGLALADRLRAEVPAGRSALAMAEAHRHLPARRALVFLVSDFHWPLADVSAVLRSLAAHDVVPVVLWQPAEFMLSAAHGLASAVEPESGARRWIWWRPALRARWQAAAAERRDALLAAMRAERREPVFVEGAFDADALTRHFAA